MNNKRRHGRVTGFERQRAEQARTARERVEVKRQPPQAAVPAAPVAPTAPRENPFQRILRRLREDRQKDTGEI